jgi:hypothetical protein
MPERVNGGQFLVVVGALALLVSLFLDWFAPGVTAWTVFEIVDLVLAAIAILALVGAVAVALPGAGIPPFTASVPLALGLIAFVLVAAALIDPPPAARSADPEIGAWIALAGAALISIGALLSVARISLQIIFAPREAGRSRTEARAGAAEAPLASEETGYEEEPPEPIDEELAVEPTEPVPTESVPTEEHRVFPEDEPR